MPKKKPVQKPVIKNDNKLYTSKDDQVIFGVCGGLGHKYNVDPIIFRIMFTILCLCTPLPAGLVYFILGVCINNSRDTL